MGNDADILQEIIAAEEDGRRRVESARQQAASRLDEARREIEEYREALLDGIGGRLATLESSLATGYEREGAQIDCAADEVLAAVEKEQGRFEESAMQYLKEVLLGGR